MPSVAELDQWRVEALEALYDSVGGDRMARVNYRELGPQTSVSNDDEAQQVFQWLVDHGLAEWAAMGGVIAITTAGIDQVEEWRRPAQGAPAAPVVLDLVEVRIVERFVSDVEAAIARGEGPADPDDAVALDSNLESIAAQQRSPKPDRGIVRAAVAAIARIGEAAAGNALGVLAVELLKRLG